MKVSPLLTIYMAIGGGGPSWRRWGLADKPMQRELFVIVKDRWQRHG
jgi:hypothetical protein